MHLYFSLLMCCMGFIDLCLLIQNIDLQEDKHHSSFTIVEIQAQGLK